MSHCKRYISVKEGNTMTQTIQSCSKAILNKTGKNLNTDKPEKEDNMSHLLSIFDGLNNLYEKLNRLNYLIERKDIEQIINNQ